MTVQQLREESHPTKAPDVSTHEGPSRPRSWVTVLVAVVALVVGGFAGWMLRGSSDDADAIVAGGGELTQRQEDMVQLLDEYQDALFANDGAAVVELMVPTGTWTGDVGEPMFVNDGSIEAFVNTFEWEPTPFLTPVLVNGDVVHFVHEYGGRPYYDTVTFTSTGDLEIVEHRWLQY